jgi:NAD(P)-dependent dehydrogenase (short-subunit alcohol dehydrogenase family)
MIINHGVPATSSLLESSDEDWMKVINIDLNGAFYVAKVATYVCILLISGHW